VVVAEDDRRGAGLDEHPEDVARMNLDAREAASRDELVDHDAMPDVEADEPELLDGQARESRSHVCPDIARGGETLSDLRSRSHALTSELKRSSDEPRAETRQ